MADKLLTQAELSEWIGKPQGTLRNWRYRKTGPAFTKVGRDVRYYQSAVEKWLRANETQAAA